MTLLRPQASPRPLVWAPIITVLREALADQTVYIVGGAVRDAYLARPIHDLDLATPADGTVVARQLANRLKGAYYPLDTERGVGRALLDWQGVRLAVDIARFRGPDLLTDLQKRDFTINALAVELGGDLQAVFDPLGGMDDLAARRLRQCSPTAIADDPVRALRAVRASIAYDLRIDPATRQAVRNHADRVAHSSPERVRDEFFQLLAGKQPAKALKVLQHLGLLASVIPETSAMQQVGQSAPHQFDLWTHTLLTVEYLDAITQIITRQAGDNLTANIQAGLIVSALHTCRAELQTHLAFEWPNHRSHRAILLFAALLHDVGKPATRSVDPDGHIHFVGHEQQGEKLIQARSQALRLSNDETARLAVIVRHHMRPHWLAGRPPLTRRAIYRFWRDTGQAGLDICLLAAADYLATYGPTLATEAWISYLETVQTLLESFYQHHAPTVTALPLLTGQDLLDQFHLKPGPQIGALLEQIREAQTTGDIQTKQEAVDLVQRLLDQDDFMPQAG